MGVYTGGAAEVPQSAWAGRRSAGAAGAAVASGGAAVTATAAVTPVAAQEEASKEHAALSFLHLEARVYEAGHAETKKAYGSRHLAADMAFHGAVSSEATREVVVSGHVMALYISESHVSGTFRDRGIDSHGTETIVLVPTEEGWMIRHIHWSSR